MVCVISGGTMSNILGLLSSVVWFFVLIPQLYKNYKAQDSDAISLFLILLWLVGDYLSMFTAQIKGISKVVVYVAIYHIIIGILFTVQIIYYRHKKYKRYFNDFYSPILDLDNVVLRQDIFNDNLVPRQDTSNDDVVLRQDIVDYYNYFLLTQNEQVFIFSSILFISILNTYFYFDSYKSILLADVVAWLTTLIFIGSRIPQIHLNHKRKSTHGLSVYSFIILNIANYLFLSSILVNICDNDGNEIQFLISNSQWIVGSISGSLLDIILFYQFYIYN